MLVEHLSNYGNETVAKYKIPKRALPNLNLNDSFLHLRGQRPNYSKKCNSYRTYKSDINIDVKWQWIKQHQVD